MDPGGGACGDWAVTGAGLLVAHGRRLRCALGRGGIRADKREGDGATPAGIFGLRRVLWRPDRGPPPVTPLPTAAIAPEDGWCDDPGHPDYNRPVLLPHPAGHERMWRDDALYDLVVVVGYNDAPVVPGKGSAIFLHLARSDYSPTAGCVAFARGHLFSILRAVDQRSRLIVQA